MIKYFVEYIEKGRLKASTSVSQKRLAKIRLDNLLKTKKADVARIIKITEDGKMTSISKIYKKSK